MTHQDQTEPIESLRQPIWRSNGLNPDNYSRAVGAAMQEYAEAFHERQTRKWRTFGTPPKAGQKIIVAWPGFDFDPEIRVLDEILLSQNWYGMVWMPFPEPPKAKP